MGCVVVFYFAQGNQSQLRRWVKAADSFFEDCSNIRLRLWVGKVRRKFLAGLEVKRCDPGSLSDHSFSPDLRSHCPVCPLFRGVRLEGRFSMLAGQAVADCHSEPLLLNLDDPSDEFDAGVSIPFGLKGFIDSVGARTVAVSGCDDGPTGKEGNQIEV